MPVQNAARNKLLPLDRVVKDLYHRGTPYQDAVKHFRRAYLGHLLQSRRNNQCAVAKELGVHRNTVHLLVAELGLRRPRKGAKPMATTDRDEVIRVFPDANIHTENTREKTTLYLITSPSHEDLAQHATGGELVRWLSCWCFSPDEAWADAARRVKETGSPQTGPSLRGGKEIARHA